MLQLLKLEEEEDAEYNEVVNEESKGEEGLEEHKEQYKKEQMQRYLTSNTQAQFRRKTIFKVQQQQSDMYSFCTLRTEYSDVTDLEFVNLCGVEVKFALSILSKLVLRPFNKEQPWSEHVKTVKAGESLILPIRDMQEVLEQQEDLGQEQGNIKVDFVVKGYRKIKNVVL